MIQHFLVTTGQYQFFQLPAFSKLFKKVMFNRLTEFLILRNILYSKQFGFGNNHSTALDLIDLISNISSAINRNESTLGIFLDLSKAFDTINHKILCYKLQHYWYSGHCFVLEQKSS